MAADRYMDCDLGLFAFLLTYRGKPKDLVDLCISQKVILQERICDKCGKKAVFSFDAHRIVAPIKVWLLYLTRNCILRDWVPFCDEG